MTKINSLFSFFISILHHKYWILLLNLSNDNRQQVDCQQKKTTQDTRAD